MKTDDELNALFAEHVAGWRKPKDPEDAWFTGDVIYQWPLFCTEAEDVLPWLEKNGYWDCNYMPERDCLPSVAYSVNVQQASGEADTFPRAAVIALLRAKGIDV